MYLELKMWEDNHVWYAWKDWTSNSGLFQDPRLGFAWSNWENPRKRSYVVDVLTEILNWAAPECKSETSPLLTTLLFSLWTFKKLVWLFHDKMLPCKFLGSHIEWKYCLSYLSLYGSYSGTEVKYLKAKKLVIYQVSLHFYPSVQSVQKLFISTHTDTRTWW